MRSEKKLANGNVITVFDSNVGNMYIREPGKVNFDNFEELIVLRPESNELVINEAVANKYGIKITRNSSEELLDAALNELTAGADGEYLRELPDLLGMTKEEAIEYGFGSAGWIKSDDLQWVKVESYHPDGTPIFDMIEVRGIGGTPILDMLEVRDTGAQYLVVRGTIDLDDYTDEDIMDYIKSYGYDSIESVRNNYPSGSDQVIAECIFECTPVVELICFGPLFNSEDEAEAYILQNLIDKEDDA